MKHTGEHLSFLDVRRGHGSTYKHDLHIILALAMEQEKNEL